MSKWVCVWTQSNCFATKLSSNSFKVVWEKGYCIWNVKRIINGPFICGRVASSKCMVHNATCTESFHCHNVCWSIGHKSHGLEIMPEIYSRAAMCTICIHATTLYTISLVPDQRAKWGLIIFIHAVSWKVWITCTCRYCFFLWLSLWRMEGTDVRLMVWDTAGQEEYDAITSAYYRGALP